MFPNLREDPYSSPSYVSHIIHNPKSLPCTSSKCPCLATSTLLYGCSCHGSSHSHRLYHPIAQISLPPSSTPDQPSNKSNSMSENSVVRTDNLPSPGSGEITRCQTRKGEVVRHCKELVHSGFVQHLQHHAHSSST